MKPEKQIRHLVHLIVDKMIDVLIHSLVQATFSSQLQGNESSSKNSPEETPKQELTPNDLQCEKAKQALKRMGWRMS